jgi:hypothetical protein
MRLNCHPCHEIIPLACCNWRPRQSLFSFRVLHTRQFLVCRRSYPQAQCRFHSDNTAVSFITSSKNRIEVDTKGKSLEEVASFPVLTPEEIAQKAPEREPEPTPGELFDGNIGKLGRVVHDVPFDGKGG